MFTLAFLTYAMLAIGLGIVNWTILPSPWNLGALFFGVVAVWCLRMAYIAAFVGRK